ncbi:MFS transporter [Anaeromyxobacter sp. Red801]|uniref:MFS transporter n=1 Tax=Anaeromyxobacter sp. Red801 TaxID=3411632 RepID=UPI003BA079F2
MTAAPPPAPDPRTVNVTDLVDAGRLGRFHLGAFAVLGGCLVMDGFDLQAMGYAAPALARDWGLPIARLGPVFGAGLLGLFLGSILAGMAADRIGRRPVLIGATAVFGAFTLATAAAGSMPALLAARFVAGLGLGAIMPNATALVGEYAPRRNRVATMMIVTNGFMVGAVAAGALSAWLVPAHGWRAPFWIGGAIPLLLLPPMARWLPESLQLLAVSGRRPAELARWLRRAAPGAPVGPGVRYTVREAPRRGFVLLELLRDGRATATVLLWLANFANMIVIYAVASWLPTLVREAGFSTATAVWAGTAVQLGGLVGTVVLGLVLQRLGFVPVLASCFAAAAACLLVLGRPGLPLAALLAVAFAVGWAVQGGQPGLNALAATFYPTDLRSTGIGAGLGVGRLGGFLGPVVAGALLAGGGGAQAVFQAAAVPAAVSALVMLALRRAAPSVGASAPDGGRPRTAGGAPTGRGERGPGPC